MTTIATKDDARFFTMSMASLLQETAEHARISLTALTEAVASRVFECREYAEMIDWAAEIKMLSRELATRPAA